MPLYKGTHTNSVLWNFRYRRHKIDNSQSGIICEICGGRMYCNEAGTFICSNCNHEIYAFIGDNQVY